MIGQARDSWADFAQFPRDGSRRQTQIGLSYAPSGDFEKSVHPVVVRRPETGRKALYVNSGFTSHIIELARFESDAVLQMLYRHIETQSALAFRIRWTPNTRVFWDNRCTQH